MKKFQRNERILYIAASVLLLSVILMGITIPGILQNTSPGARPKAASLAVAAAILIRLIILIGYLKIIKESKRTRKNRKGEYIGIGALLLILGLVYMDGAIAFFPDENMLLVSLLMFSSTFCDFVASLMTFVLFFLKPQKMD